MNLVGVRAKERRIELHLSQAEVCSVIEDITQNAWRPTRHDLYRIEVGSRIVSDAEVVALAVALRCPLTWLMVGNGSELPLEETAQQIFSGAQETHDTDATPPNT